MLTLIQNLHLTQEEVANAANITTFHLSKIENNKVNGSLETYAVLAKILNLELSYLMTGISRFEEYYIDGRVVDLLKNEDESQIELIIKLIKAVLE